VTVRDTGIGIDASVLPHVFEVFQQADQGLDRTRGGLGLGLALVKGLADLHQGTISVASEGLGKGAIFTLRIPAERADAAADGNSAPIAAADTRKRRILIIEDSYDAAITSRMILEREGHEVRVAENGNAGVAVAHEFLPQVILCDIGLPGIDGYQVARMLRQDPILAGIYLVALTGYGRDADKRRAREAGFDRHMTKPIDFSMLRQTLSGIPAE
jgi:CheY-like chemotaxis protein